MLHSDKLKAKGELFIQYSALKISRSISRTETSCACCECAHQLQMQALPTRQKAVPIIRARRPRARHTGGSNRPLICNALLSVPPISAG